MVEHLQAEREMMTTAGREREMMTTLILRCAHQKAIINATFRPEPICVRLLLVQANLTCADSSWPVPETAQAIDACA
jgi:hypothetical protein